MKTLKEKDVNIIQDSRIALQVVNKAMQADKGFNFIYIDNRQAVADSRQVTRGEAEPDQVEDNRIFASVIPSELGKVPRFVQDEFERVLKKCPEPRLGHIVKMMFEIAFDHGNIDEQRGRFLGVGKGKFQYWRKKLGIRN